MARRSFLRQLAAVPLFAAGAAVAAETPKRKLKIMMKSAWGADDPTKAAFFVSMVEWSDRIITE
jgi:hypothetical protein